MLKFNCKLLCKYFKILNVQQKILLISHPSLECIGAPWVGAQESRQHPDLLDTDPNKMTATILNLYGSYMSSST